MTTKNLKTTLIIATLLVGIFAGVLFTASLAISPSLVKLDATNFILVKQEQIKILQVVMSTVSMVYLVLAVWGWYGARKLGKSKTGIYTLLALLLVIGALIYSAFTDIGYNQAILSWNPATPPADWSSIREQWAFANIIRTFPVMLAFLFQITALAFTDEK